MTMPPVRRGAHLALAMLFMCVATAPAQEDERFVGPLEAEQPGIETEAGPDALPVGRDRGPPDEPAFIPGVWRVDECELAPLRDAQHPPMPSPKALAGIDYPEDFPRGVVTETIQPKPTEQVEQYIADAYGIALMEQAAARIVLNSTADERLKAYAYRMLKSQDQIATDLRRLALCVGMELPDGLTPAAEDELQELRKRSGPNFAYRYLRMSIELNEHGIFVYRQLELELVDPLVRLFARNYKPVLMIMLDQALGQMGGLVPIAGRELHGVAYFDRHGDLGRPTSRGVPDLGIEGPPPGQLDVMPSNRQPAVTAPYHKPPVKQWLRAGPGLGPEPAPIPEEIDNQTLPATDDVYVRGIPDSQTPGLDLPPADQPPAAEVFGLRLHALIGRPVIGPGAETIGEIQAVQVEQADPAASRLIVALNKLLGDRRIALNLADVTLRPADGAVLVPQIALEQAVDLRRPNIPPPVSGVDPPDRALPAPATSSPDQENFGFTDQDEDSDRDGEGGPNQDPRRNATE